MIVQLNRHATQKTVREKKRDCFAEFAGEVAENPDEELLKIMNSIRGGDSMRNSASGLVNPSITLRLMQIISASSLLRIVQNVRWICHM